MFFKRYHIRIAILACIVLSCSAGVSAQTSRKLDSLKSEYNSAKHDTSRARLMLELSDVYRSLKSDSSFIFIQSALDLTEKKLSAKNVPFNEQCCYKLYKAHALKQYGVLYRNKFEYEESIRYFRRAYIIYHEIADIKDTAIARQGKVGMSNCHTLIGHNFDYLGNYDEAIMHFEKSLLFGELLGDRNMISTAYNNIGNVHSDQGRFDKAVDFFLKALKIKEDMGDKPGMASCYNNLGIVQWNQENHEKSIDYFRKSLKIYEETNDTKSAAGSNNNIGNILADQGKYNEAIEYYRKAMEFYEKLGDKRGLYNCYNNMGIVSTDLGDHKKALEYYNKALVLCYDLNEKRGLTMVYGNLADLNVKMADSLPAANSQRAIFLKKAVDYGTNAFDIADEIGALPWKSIASEQLVEAYESLGNFTKAFYYAKVLLQCKDSMFDEDKTQALEEMQARYESDKKQLEIDKMTKEKELDTQTIIAQQAENRKQLIMLISVIGGLFIVLVFSFVVFRMFRQKKQAYFLLSEQNEEIRQQKEEIQSQRDEIESQCDQVQSQKEQIEQLYDIAVIRKNIVEKQNEEIEDSIRYARRIQTATLPSDAQMKSLFGEYFLFFRPKDVVSGDFYWITHINDWLVVTVADCTGHGVPGAFMSMLGISFLDEIVRKKEISDAAAVLNKLRGFIIEALRQTGDTGTQKDGMDMSLAAINTKTLKCLWAGANNPLYIVKNQKLAAAAGGSEEGELKTAAATAADANNGQLTELRPDKMPVAVHIRMDSFTNHEIQLHHGDKLYFFSDGYPDQFGGKQGRKYLYKPFKELIEKTSSLSMADQGREIETAFDNWTGTEAVRYPQVDDVTVLGIRI